MQPPDQQQGKRTDLDLIVDMVKDNKNIREIGVAYPSTYVRNYKGINQYRELMYKPKYRPDIAVIFKFGETGLGKTYDTMMIEYPGCYKKPIGKSLWFDGFDHEKEVLIDEFRGQWPLTDVLQLLDSAPCRVEVKGGHMHFDPDVIILCSNDHPSDMYTDHTSASRRAFFRRLKIIHYYIGRNKYILLNEDERNLFLSDRRWFPKGVTTFQPEIRFLSNDVLNERTFGLLGDKVKEPYYGYKLDDTIPIQLPTSSARSLCKDCLEYYCECITKK